MAKTYEDKTEPNQNASSQPQGQPLNYCPPEGAKGIETPKTKTPPLVMALAVVFALLVIGIVVGNTGRKLEPANRVACGGRLKSIGIALIAYADANHGELPNTIGTLMTVEDVTPAIFICPSSNDDVAPGKDAKAMAANIDDVKQHYCSYVYAVTGKLLSDLKLETVVVYENPTNHNNGGMNVLYGDFQVKWVAAPEHQRIIAELKAGFNPPRPAK